MTPPVGDKGTSASHLATAAWQPWAMAPRAARDAALEALAASEAQGDAIARAGALAALGHAWVHLGFLDKAEATLAEAHAGAIASSDALATARALVAIGVLRQAQGRHAEAAATLRAAGDIFRRLDDVSGLAGVSLQRAMGFERLGAPAQALALLRSAESGFLTDAEHSGEALTLIHAIRISGQVGDQAASLAGFRRLRDLLDTLGSPGLAVHAALALAGGLAMAGDRVQAIALAERAVALAPSSGSPGVLVEALGSLGALLADSAPDRAEGLIAEAARQVDGAAGASTVATAQLALADTWRRLGNLEGSRGVAEAAAGLAAAHGAHRLAARAWRHAALVCEALGDLTAAVARWREADAARTAGDAERKAHDRILLAVTADPGPTPEAAEPWRSRLNEVAAATRFRSDLFGVVAHDLRSPLTAAMMSVDLLTERATTRTDAQLIDDLGLALLRQKRIIEALSDGDDERAFAVNLADEDLLGLARAIAHEHQASALSKRVIVGVEGPPTLVRCDAGRLAHAIDNLVANGVKYAPPGTEVRVRLVSRPGVVRLEVEDEGPRVAPGEVGKLFKPQGEGAATPTGVQRTTGLGLFIARRMVDLHNGSLGAEAGAVGARFWFEIPV